MLTRRRAADAGPSPLPVLAYVLDRSLRLLHPVMPFVTEELWQALTAKIDGIDEDALIVAAYPRGESGYSDAGGRARDGDADRRRARDPQHPRREEGRAGEVHRGVRRRRTARARVLEAGAPYIEMLARARPLHIVGDIGEAPRDQVATAVLEGVTAIVPLAGLFDVEAERARLQKQIADAEAEAGRIEAKLANEQFRSKAPEKVIAAEEERLAAVRTRLDGLRARRRGVARVGTASSRAGRAPPLHVVSQEMVYTLRRLTGGLPETRAACGRSGIVQVDEERKCGKAISVAEIARGMPTRVTASGSRVLLCRWSVADRAACAGAGRCADRPQRGSLRTGSCGRCR